jgi:glycosyltransferase involved in cell wall biosynthesis
MKNTMSATKPEEALNQRKPPTLAVVIVTKDRATLLDETLRRLQRQTWRPDEIVVVDDHSCDETQRLCRELGDQIRYIRLPRSQGCLYGRNLAAFTTSCEFTLSLDDDSWFVDDDALEQGVTLLLNQSHVAVLAFNIRSVDGSLQFPPTGQASETYTFTGCGYLLRNAALQGRPPYLEFFQGQGEEKALSMQLYASGWIVLSVPYILVHHEQSLEGRNWNRVRLREHRNDILRELMMCPGTMLPWAIMKTWISHTRYNFSHHHWATDLRVLLSLVDKTRFAFLSRSPMTKESYRRWQELRNALDK